MTLALTADLVADAIARGAAVPAFNVISLEQAEAVVGGATDSGVPVLLQISQNAIRFHGDWPPLLAACRELAVAAGVTIGIHIDHVDDSALATSIIRRAAAFGIGSLMFDASHLDYAENTALTAAVVRAGHACGVWVEGELGKVGGKDGAHAPGVRTDPTEAREFVAATGVDALAVAVGSSHAMQDRSARLDLDLIARLATAVGVPLVLHGSSGVDDEMLIGAVGAGIRKVNIGTALGIAGTARLRSELDRQPDATDPRKYLTGVRQSTRELTSALAALIGRSAHPRPSTAYALSR